MAIDPATLKMAAKAAIKVLTDEEARKKMIMVALAPVIGVIVLIALIFQIIISPFEAIANFFKGDDLAKVESLQQDYGYLQNLGFDSDDYLESSGTEYRNVTFKDGQTEVVYFNQLDNRWAYELYGKSSLIGEAGCGPTSLAMVVSTLTGNIYDPVYMCDWSYKNGYYCEGKGSYHSLIPNGARNFGLNVEGATANEPQKIVDALSSGKLVIAIMSKGNFTTSGHFIVLRGVTAEGKILVADPASKRRSEREWDLQTILNETNKNAGAGDPLWIISR